MAEEQSGDGQGTHPGDGPWLTVAAAARRLGISPRAVRGRIRRGTIEWKAQGNAGKLVRVPDGDGSPGPSRDAVEDGSQDAYELALLREELTEARIALARSEERVAARDQRVVDLADQVADLEAELREERKGWLLRLVEAWRR